MQTKPTLKLFVALALAATAATGFTVATTAQAQTTPAAESVPAVFKRLDTNGDGKLSKAEAGAMPALAEKFVELDKDKDGALSMEEFSVAFTK